MFTIQSVTVDAIDQFRYKFLSLLRTILFIAFGWMRFSSRGLNENKFPFCAREFPLSQFSILNSEKWRSSKMC